VPVNYFIFRRFVPKHVRETADRSVAIIPKQIIKFASGNYLGAIFYQATTTLLPIIVVEQLGAVQNAYFYLPWTITTSLQMIGLNMAASFTVEASRDPKNLNLYAYRVLSHNLKMMVPLIAVIVLGAPYILSIFGANYAANGTEVLRLLALSVLPYSMTALYVGLARVQNRVNRIAVIQGVRCFLVLGLSYVLLPVLNITGVGWVWLVTETLIGGFLLVTQLLPILKSRGRLLETDQAAAPSGTTK
jgi:O-antigen/teichoic acid export membrane protein